MMVMAEGLSKDALSDAVDTAKTAMGSFGVVEFVMLLGVTYLVWKNVVNKL